MDELSNENFKLFTPEEIEKLKKERGYYASYGGSKENQYKDSHLVSIGVQINGSDYFTHTNLQLELRQKINGIHEFELVADPDEFGESKAYLLQNSRAHLGKRITFTFRQYGKAASLFTGIITEISTRKKEGNKHIVLRGKSPCILLQNGQNSRSFEQKTFEDIIKEVTKDYPQNLVSFHINPNYKEKLAYTVQYNQSDYDFLRRLGNRYGEYFYFDGEKHCFSSWGGKIVELMEGEDYFDHDLKIQVAPQSFSYTSYDAKQSSDYTVDSASQSIQQSENPFQQFAVNASEGVFTVSPTAHYDQSLLLSGQTEVQKSVERERKKRQNLVYVEASSNNPNLRVGDVAKMMAWIPDHEIFKSGRVPVESYKITEIIHRFGDGDGYSNTFIGIPKDLTVPNEYDESKSPKAELQHATVTDNKDPLQMGRVRVQFVWQKPNNQQTPWIQLIQPHAGAGKGTYINPEIGETVLVAFQGGNAEAPIVLGTAYNGGEIAEYYTEGNDIKVIQTRSQTRIVFNDAEGSILITDPSGNSWLMDGQGNINVNAPKNMSVTVGENMDISVGQNLTIDAGENITETAGNDINQTAVGHFTENANSKSEFIDKDFYRASDSSVEVAGTVDVSSISENVELRSATTTQINSAEKSNLF